MLVATMANSSYQNLFILMSLEKNFDEDLLLSGSTEIIMYPGSFVLFTHLLYY